MRTAMDPGLSSRGARRTCAAIVAALLLLLVAAPCVAMGAGLSLIERDPSGLGLILPYRLWASGDATVAVTVPKDDPAKAEVDDVSLLARWDPLDRLSFFTELRLEDLFEVVAGEKGQVGGNFIVERLYAEALLTPQLSARLGKVYTPFGLWNVISRAPLTWTVERPAVTEDVFPERATGLSLLYQTTWQGWSLDGTAYGPAQDEITPAEEAQGLMFGTRVAAGHAVGPAYAALGLNAAGFGSFDRADWTTASGFDVEVDVGGHEITGEFTYRVPTTGANEHGLYLQDAFPLYRSLYGVLRFEYFQPDEGRAAVGQLLGLFWRPIPTLVLKADYLFGTRQLENFQPGFTASVSVLF